MTRKLLKGCQDILHMVFKLLQIFAPTRCECVELCKCRSELAKFKNGLNAINENKSTFVLGLFSTTKFDEKNVKIKAKVGKR